MEKSDIEKYLHYLRNKLEKKNNSKRENKKFDKIKNGIINLIDLHIKNH